MEGAPRSLLGLRYPDYEVIFVNDRSTDRTGEIAERLGADDPRLEVLHIAELPPGWFGKPHAAQRGADAATGEVLLFTDADVVFAPDAFFGVGSYTIMRADSYRALGGHARVALRPDEDLRLGQAVKLSGMRSAFLKGEALMECRWYHSLGGFIRGLEKNFFAALDYSVFMVTGATATLVWLAVGPLVLAPVLLATGQVLAGLLFTACPLVYWTVATTVSRDDSYPCWSAIPLPLAILIIAYTIWRSALLTIFRGVVWGGPAVPLAELKGTRTRGRVSSLRHGQNTPE